MDLDSWVWTWWTSLIPAGQIQNGFQVITVASKNKADIGVIFQCSDTVISKWKPCLALMMLIILLIIIILCFCQYECPPVLQQDVVFQGLMWFSSSSTVLQEDYLTCLQHLSKSVGHGMSRWISVIGSCSSSVRNVQAALGDTHTCTSIKTTKTKQTAPTGLRNIPDQARSQQIILKHHRRWSSGAALPRAVERRTAPLLGTETTWGSSSSRLHIWSLFMLKAFRGDV